MKSKFFALNGKDFVNGLVVAVLAAVFAYFSPIINSADFSWTQVDWGQFFNIIIVSVMGYMTKNLFSDSEGKVVTPIGKIG